MRYLPHTEMERRSMLETLGLVHLEELFTDIPKRVRFPGLELPAPVAQMDLERHLRTLAASNVNAGTHECYLGAGAYHHYIPATVDYVIGRGEFFTSYTPYQAEASQGMLQAMFEYQSMICQLTGMEVTNASHYDGATALAEAVRMALSLASNKQQKVILSPAINLRYRDTVRTYLQGTEASLVGEDAPPGDMDSLISLLDDKVATLVIQNPNFFGQFEDVTCLVDAVHDAGALLIVVADPIALGRFQSPGAYGADVVVADGQPLGIPLSFGGPHLGIFATRKKYVRHMPGRLVGETVDKTGRRGYVLTLAAREQHIRRARATSNICTNAGLMALAAATYLATLGESGLRQVAELCYHKSHYAAERIAEIPGLEVNPQASIKPFFKEFSVSLPRPVEEVNRILLEEFGIIGGFDLGSYYPALERHMLIAVTEMKTRAAIDRLVDALVKATK
jgi:glycine cleavage system P protein (glycine dehydrogenase) subunit 1